MTVHDNHTPHDDSHLTDDRYRAKWEKAFNRMLSPFEEFIRNQTTGGIILMSAALVALLVANSPLAGAYHHLLETPLGFRFGDWGLEKSLHHWINDGLMTLFFFLVGLEIKREVMVGELSTPSQAALPVLAAVGGMVAPALVYYAIGPDGIGARGWGIPMATDIAFAVGALVLLGKRVPASLMTFLVALAIVDDLGAVVVIAIFYSDALAVEYLLLSAVLFFLLAGFNRGGIRNPLPYFVVGTVLWLAMLKSGVHATIAGVLMALTIPARPKYDPMRFAQHIRELLGRFENTHRADRNILANENQHSILQTMENGVHLVETPLQRLEHALQRPVALLVMPIFALANAGVPLDLGRLHEALVHPVTTGVGLGMVVGKFIGIAGFTWLGLRLGLGRLPAGMRFGHVIGVALLGGIGFTMSIFIAELAFTGAEDQLVLAKTGILSASLVAGTLGYVWLHRLAKREVL